MAPAPPARIAVFGSVNMDLVAYADTAPRMGETVTGREFRAVPGGKGANQAIAAARAGADVSFLGAVGDDPFGVQLRGALLDAECDLSRLRTVPGASGTAHIVVDGAGDNSIIVVPGANGTVEDLAPDDVAVLRGCAILLLQLESPLPAVTAAARVGRELGLRIVLTPAPARPLPDELLEAVDLLVPNRHEAAALSGEDDPERALAALLRRVPEVVITMGADGVLSGRQDAAAPVRIPARRVRAVDTTAAGDTFCGALAAALGEGRDREAALRFAVAAASLSVQRYGAGTSMPARAEIEEAAGSGEAPGPTR